MRESVSAVFVTSTKIFFIKRQNYLSVFPGYYATPGGKIDKSESEEELLNTLWPKDIKPQILHALIREVQEELNYNLIEGVDSGEVLAIDLIGIAITPEFNPYRFKNYYLKITLKSERLFEIDLNEAEFGLWRTPEDLHELYKRGEMLAVPPAINLLKALVTSLNHSTLIDMSLPYHPDLEIPMIESLCGVRQFLPLSNTFPPANRTNSFIIGDGLPDAPKYLIDPSPKNEEELQKFLRSILKIGFDRILLTHHHLDHYQFSAEIARLCSIGIELSSDTLNRIKKQSGENYFEGITLTIRKEGDILTKSLGHIVRVYEVPGHDEGQLAIAPDNMMWFLAGDLIQTIGTVVIQAPEGDMKKYFESLERVIKLNPQNIIPSHGIIVGGIHKIHETLNHRKMREASIRDLLNNHKSEQEILELIYMGLAPELIPFAQRTIQAHIKKINEKDES
jgi:glyoxylase-like metal-dependent hydrolase (beta-lactamase superfamily II)/8-oxo-dGTP pyrophosphatase MutT (NUDIX family)